MVPRVMVVQSRPEAALRVSASLADAGLEPVVLADSHRVLHAIDRWDPRAVLVDLTLPALDGWYVLAQIGALFSRPLVVVRINDARDVDRAVALGADACVDDDAHLPVAAHLLVAAHRLVAAGKLGTSIAA